MYLILRQEDPITVLLYNVPDFPLRTHMRKIKTNERERRQRQYKLLIGQD